MTIRNIIKTPNSKLREISKPIEKVDDDIRRLMDDMLETMYAANGIGLAAIQVGIAKRIIVMDLAIEGEPNPLYFANPKIINHAKTLTPYNEGCLSVPDFFDDVDRPPQCVVSFLDYNNKKQKLECEGLLAVCIQHEIDHLEGILFIDHLSRLKRQLIMKKIKKQNVVNNQKIEPNQIAF